jgi:hypothetical protein
MRVTCKAEQSLFDFDEFEVIRTSHHPAIYALDRPELVELRGKLRRLRERERSLAHHKQREARGKAEPRGAAFPGTAEAPHRRDLALTAALRRVAKELARQASLEARAANAEAARRAFALHRASKFVHHPAAEPTAAPDVSSVPSRRRRHQVAPWHIGRVSQHTKSRQAARDSRNAP